MILESTIESYLVAEVERRGGIAEKIKTIGRRGCFDRVVVLPVNMIYWVELKRPKGGRISPHQRDRIAQYKSLGARVRVCKTIADVDDLLDEYDRQA